MNRFLFRRIVTGSGLVLAVSMFFPRGQVEYFFHSAVLISTPLILAGLAEMLVEKSGLINIGLEAIILAGAFAGFFAAENTGSLSLGAVAASSAGLLVAVLFGLMCILLRNDQIITGAGLNFLVFGATGFLYRFLYGATGSTVTVTPFTEWNLLGLGDLPYLGPVLFRLTVLSYFAFGLGLLIHFLWYRTNIGFHIEAVGEHPRAADTAGISVPLVRWTTLLIQGVLGGLAGASLSLAASNTFNEGMSNGRGFIALAVVIFGRWRPLGVMAAAMVFGAAESLQLLLQATETPLLRNNYPYLQMLPYLVTLIVLATAGRSVQPPSALGKHYHRE